MPPDVRSTGGQRGFSLESGAWADFRQARRLCLTARDSDLQLDLRRSLKAAIRRALPDVTVACDLPFDGIRVEYTSSYSVCTHCPEPYRGPRFGFGFLWRETAGRRSALALWVDANGGTPDEVVTAFAEDVAVFLIDPEKARRSDAPAAEH